MFKRFYAVSKNLNETYEKGSSFILNIFRNLFFKKIFYYKASYLIKLLY